MGLYKDKHDLQSSSRGGAFQEKHSAAMLQRDKKNLQDYIYRCCKTVSHVNNCKERQRKEF